LKRVLAVWKKFENSTPTPTENGAPKKKGKS